MNIRIDTSHMDAIMAQFQRKAETLGPKIIKDVAILVQRVMVEKVPVETGLLTTSIWLFDEGDRYLIGPTVKYAKYPLFYGKRKTKHSTTYPERTIETVKGLVNPVLNAALEENLRV